jgi:hypothetical protein
MPNNKTERKARIAAAKEARTAAGVNMFSPDVGVKIVGINNAPSAKNALYGRANLRAPNTFTGNGFSRQLSAEEKRQAKSLLSEKRENNAKTKRASTPNRWGETGNSYLHSRTAANQYNERQHRKTIIAATRNIEEARKLEEEARLKKLFEENEEADKLLSRAANLRKEVGYTVAEPTPKSLKNMAMVHEFAKGIHAKQTTKKGLFGNCFGAECSVESEKFIGNNTVTRMPRAITGSGKKQVKSRGRRTRRRRN